MPAYRFFHPAELRYADLDPQGHVNNARYLTLFEQARIHYWIRIGLFSKDQSFTEIGVIIADIHIRYQEPLHWGMPVKVGVSTTRIGNKSLSVDQCIVDESGQRIYASGTVVLVAYDYENHRSMRVPDLWRERFEQFEGRKLG